MVVICIFIFLNKIKDLNALVIRNERERKRELQVRFLALERFVCPNLRRFSCVYQHFEPRLPNTKQMTRSLYICLFKMWKIGTFFFKCCIILFISILKTFIFFDIFSFEFQEECRGMCSICWFWCVDWRTIPPLLRYGGRRRIERN